MKNITFIHYYDIESQENYATDLVKYVKDENIKNKVK